MGFGGWIGNLVIATEEQSGQAGEKWSMAIEL